MKKLLFIIALLFALTGSANVFKLEIIGNYMVITDTTTSGVTQYAVGSIYNYQIIGNYVYIYYADSKKITYKLSDLIDENETAFTSSTLNTFLRENTGFNGGGASSIPTDSVYSNYTGWAAYNDTEYTELSPFSISAGEKKTLPNNASSSLETQLPTDVDTFYDATDSVITGRNGDGLLWTVEFRVKPTSAAADIRVLVLVDIGGAVGELYPREQSLTKGNGVEHYYVATSSGYTLDTWEANGGKVKIQAINGPIDVYSIRYVITRTHKAR